MAKPKNNNDKRFAPFDREYNNNNNNMYISNFHHTHIVAIFTIKGGIIENDNT